MDVYSGKESGKSLVASEFAFTDREEEVDYCAFAEFVNTGNSVALDSVLIKGNAVTCLRFYVETSFGFFRRNPLCFCGGILTKLFDNFFEDGFLLVGCDRSRKNAFSVFLFAYFTVTLFSFIFAFLMIFSPFDSFVWYAEPRRFALIVVLSGHFQTAGCALISPVSLLWQRTVRPASRSGRIRYRLIRRWNPPENQRQ